MDILSDILDLIRLRGSLYFKTEFSPPWAVEIPAYGQVARFHFVMRGDCWVHVAGQAKPVFLRTGDLAVIPRGASHILKDAPETTPAILEDVLAKSGFTGEGALVYGGDDTDAACRLVCGHFEFDEEVKHPLLSALPAMLHIPATAGVDYSWLDSALRFVAHEAGADLPGSSTILRRLSEIIFVQMIRGLETNDGYGLAGISALQDPNLRRAMHAIHHRPGDDWTVETLAQEALMSRTRFSIRFRDRMSMPPMEYVTLWRMQIARRLIKDSDRSMIDIANQVGYSSDSAFSRAFTRCFGNPPSALRAKQKQI